LAWRYEFYVRVARTISHEWASLTREILFLPLEHKIHIFSPPCNILYICNTSLTRFVLFAIVCWFDVDVLKRQLVVSEQGETGVPYFPMYKLTFPDLKICPKNLPSTYTWVKTSDPSASQIISIIIVFVC